MLRCGPICFKLLFDLEVPKKKPAAEACIMEAAMKKLMFVTPILTLLRFSGMNSEAANHYVGAGARGANNGTDWTNSYTKLIASSE